MPRLRTRHCRRRARAPHVPKTLPMLGRSVPLSLPGKRLGTLRLRRAKVTWLRRLLLCMQCGAWSPPSRLPAKGASLRMGRAARTFPIRVLMLPHSGAQYLFVWFFHEFSVSCVRVT